MSIIERLTNEFEYLKVISYNIISEEENFKLVVDEVKSLNSNITFKDIGCGLMKIVYKFFNSYLRSENTIIQTNSLTKEQSDKINSMFFNLNKIGTTIGAGGLGMLLGGWLLGPLGAIAGTIFGAYQGQKKDYERGIQNFYSDMYKIINQYFDFIYENNKAIIAEILLKKVG